MFRGLPSFILIFALACLQTAQPACPDGVPYDPDSALAGAGFSALEKMSVLPSDYNLYEFRGAVVPIPDQLVRRVVLAGDEGGVRQIYIQGEGPHLLWSAYLAPRQENDSAPLETLLRKGVSDAVRGGHRLERTECVDSVTALLALDEFSDEASTAAYDLGSALALHGRGWGGRRWDVFWRNSKNELTYFSWNLTRENVGILSHFNAASPTQSRDQQVQSFLSCIEENEPEVCQEFDLPGISVELFHELFKAPGP